MQTFIYIATTQGPVRVQAITEEDSDIKSVVCLDGLAEPLAISDRYHDFVKKGTGLIHRKFGHGSYRVDVDKPIDQGDSWQLGLYCAHVLHKEKLLRNELPKRGDRIFFVTGRVKSSGEIASVNKISEKYEAAAGQFGVWANLGCQVTVLLPTSLATTISDKEKGKVSTAEIQYVNNVIDVPGLLVEELIVVAESKTKSDKKWVFIGFLCLLVLVGYQVFGHLYEKGESTVEITPLEITPLEKPALKKMELQKLEVEQSGLYDGELTLVAHVAEQKGNCKKTTNESVHMNEDRWFRPVSFSHLCGLTYQANTIKALFAFSLDRLGMIFLAKKQSGWSVPLPLDQRNNRRYALIAVHSGDIHMVERGLQKQLLYWSLQESGISLLDIERWAKNQQEKLAVYAHILAKRK